MCVETEPIHNYDVYKVNDMSKAISRMTNANMTHKFERTERILNALNMSQCGLTFAKEGEHRIYMKPGTDPVNTKQYRIPHGQKVLVQEKIAEMLKHGIIEPSTSLWNSPILLFPKKSSKDKKEYRFCVDYKNVNKTTETRTYPMPNLEEELCKMNGSKYFSALDIASAFHQIKMHEPDKQKTEFSTGNQKYHFSRMLFGLQGSPITWQAYITALLGDLLNKNVMVYMDDILIYSSTVNEHVEILVEIFTRLRNSGLKLNIDKTKLFCKHIEYLGHSISANGVKPTERNIEAIKNCPTPKNMKETQRFLGMASYFRKFINNFASKAQPLHHLCKKNVEFRWTDDCEKSFSSLKNALITSPVLIFPDFSKKFYISVDASFYAVGAYISNDPPPNDRPIEYFSKTLNDIQRNYSTTHKELLAIILAIERFQHYIWGKRFVLYTDHQALTYLFGQNKVGSRLLRWKLTLAEYDFEIIHRRGSNNIVSDCLSRFEPASGVNICHFVKNAAMKTILQAVTRSRARESEIIANNDKTNENNENKKKQKYISEEPSITLDLKKFDKILFIVDNQNFP